MRMGGTGFEYDANTNLVAYGYDNAGRKTKYSYDDANRLMYGFDAGNRKTNYDSNTNLTGYRYDSRNLLVLEPYPDPACRSVAWPSAQVGENRPQSYVYGSYIDEVLYMVKANGERFFYSTNDLYSVYALMDGTGNVVERYVYDPYGAVIVMDSSGTPRTGNQSAYGNPWTFTGRRLDQETGLMQFRNRMYSVDLGRFLQRDPLKTLLPLIAHYGFCQNQVDRAQDPMGLLSFTDVAGWIPIIGTIVNGLVDPAGSKRGDYKYLKVTKEECCELGKAAAESQCVQRIAVAAAKFEVSYFASGIGRSVATAPLRGSTRRS